MLYYYFQYNKHPGRILQGCPFNPGLLYNRTSRWLMPDPAPGDPLPWRPVVASSLLYQIVLCPSSDQTEDRISAGHAVCRQTVIALVLCHCCFQAAAELARIFHAAWIVAFQHQENLHRGYQILRLTILDIVIAKRCIRLSSSDTVYCQPSIVVMVKRHLQYLDASLLGIGSADSVSLNSGAAEVVCVDLTVAHDRVARRRRGESMCRQQVF